MAKGVGTHKHTFKIMGIKVAEYTLNWLWNETQQDIEEIRDDIIIHENILKNKYNEF